LPRYLSPRPDFRPWKPKSVPGGHFPSFREFVTNPPVVGGIIIPRWATVHYHMVPTFARVYRNHMGFHEPVSVDLGEVHEESAHVDTHALASLKSILRVLALVNGLVYVGILDIVIDPIVDLTGCIECWRGSE